MAKVTLQSIADVVGVSRMTVSNAFSRPDQLSAELRERILDTAADLGYWGPDPAARALARGRTGAVGLVVADPLSAALTDAVFAELLGAVSDRLRDRDLALTVIAPERPGGAAHNVRDVAMDGAMIYVCGPTSGIAEILRARGLPFVAIDQRGFPDMPSVGIDDRDGARKAARHVLDLGHRRIGLLALEDPDRGSPERAPESPAHERLTGWLEELGAAGVEPVVAGARFLETSDPYAVARTMLEETDITAMLCFSDAFALAAVRAAQDLGRAVPEQLSVVGFDDGPLAAASRPPLTTIRQDVQAKATIAVDTLVELVEDSTRRSAERVQLPTTLVVRGTTAPPPA